MSFNLVVVEPCICSNIKVTKNTSQPSTHSLVSISLVHHRVISSAMATSCDLSKLEFIIFLISNVLLVQCHCQSFCNSSLKATSHILIISYTHHSTEHLH